MTYPTFYRLFREALAQPILNDFLAQAREIDPAASPQDLRDIHTAAHLPVRTMIARLGISQAAFAERFCVPLRTVEAWATGKRTPAPWTRLLLLRALSFADPMDGLRGVGE